MGGKPYSLSLPDRQYKWSKMETLPHFILWGRLTGVDIAHLAITERHIHSVIWENRVTSIKKHDYDLPARHILEKFERLWPCQFLAKEYGHGVETV